MLVNVPFLIPTVMINFFFGNSARAFTDRIVQKIFFRKGSLVNDSVFVYKLCLVLNPEIRADLVTCKTNIHFNCAE